MTIGVPVYNAERYLPEALDSLLRQDYADFELLISDNGSTDRTQEICRRYVSQDSRIRFLPSDRNHGAAYNYNRLVALAQGEYFKWAAYDDICDPAYVGSCVAALDEQPDAVLAYPKTVIIDSDGDVVSEFEDRLALAEPEPWRRLRSFTQRWNLCNACFGVMRTSVLKQTCLIRPYVSSDVVFLADMALRGQFVEIPHRLFYRRVHERSSRQGEVPLDQVHVWFNPASRRPKLSPRMIVLVETLKLVLRSELSGLGRARCAAAFLMTWVLRRARVEAGRAKRRVRSRLVTGGTQGTSPATAGRTHES